MNIHDLKRLNLANGGYFFTPESMRFHGDTMKNFAIEKLDEDRVRVTRKDRPGAWIFSSKTGRMVWR